MDPEKAQKVEKRTGYTLLVIGTAVIIIAVIVALWTLLTGMQVPQLVPMTMSGESDNVKSLIALSNICIVFFLYIVIVWAGSIISSRGVTMIKDVKLKLVQKSVAQATETIARTRKVKAQSV